MRPRLVLDTNIIVSALVFQSSQIAWLRSAWQNDQIRSLISHDTKEELIRVFSYPKFKLCDTEREDLLNDYLPFCEFITIPNQSPSVPQCRDHSDRKFIELALVGQANAIVTGDNDLLALKEEFIIPIVSVDILKSSMGRPWPCCPSP